MIPLIKVKASRKADMATVTTKRRRAKLRNHKILKIVKTLAQKHKIQFIFESN